MEVEGGQREEEGGEWKVMEKGRERMREVKESGKRRKRNEVKERERGQGGRR